MWLLNYTSLKTKITYKEIWNIAYPIILGSIVQNIISVTDTAFLGRVGEVELGAAAIGGVFYLTLIMLGFGFSIGVQIIVARRMGETKEKVIGNIIEQSHYFLMVLAVLIIAVMFGAIPKILPRILHSQDIVISTSEYLNYRIFGLMFAFINYGFRAFYIGIARTKVITYTTIFMALANVFFDYALIFGKFGFPQLGIAGAAIASVIAELIACIFFIIYTLKYVDLKFFGLFKFKRIDFQLLKSILRVSFPMMMQNFISFTGWFFFFLFVEKMGEHALAISNIVRSAYVVMLIPVWGFASATNTLVSFVIGKNRNQEVIPIVIKVIKVSLIGIAVLVGINIIFPELILSIYTNDINLITDSQPVLYMVSVSSFCIAFGFVFFSGVSGTGMTRISFLFEAGVIIIYIGLTYLFVNVLKLSIQMVWSVEVIYGLIIGFISFLYLKFGNWQNKII